MGIQPQGVSITKARSPKALKSVLALDFTRGLATFSLVFAALALSACALLEQPKVKKKSAVKGCNLPADQSQTMVGQWAGRPVPVAFYTEGFTLAEMEAIMKAMDGWNDHFKETRGFPAFDYEGSGNLTPECAPGRPSTCAIARPQPLDCASDAGRIIRGSSFIKPVVIYKVNPWPYDSSAIAVTNYCPPEPGKILPYHYNVIMEINTQHFFNGGQRLPHLESVFKHELGHVLGLDHSCGGEANRAGFPYCNSSATPRDYLAAVMYPVLGFSGSQGEVKTGLNINDQTRANCLFEGFEGAAN